MKMRSKEKWVKYLLQYLNKKNPTSMELELIYWTETTNFEPMCLKNMNQKYYENNQSRCEVLFSN